VILFFFLKFIFLRFIFLIFSVICLVSWRLLRWLVSMLGVMLSLLVVVFGLLGCSVSVWVRVVSGSRRMVV